MKLNGYGYGYGLPRIQELSTRNKQGEKKDKHEEKEADQLSIEWKYQLEQARKRRSEN